MKHEGKTMKKVLFATTALVATAGVAAADISLSGSAEMGLFGGDTISATAGTVTNRATQFHQDIEVTFTLSGETDNGLSFGASIQLDEASWTDSTDDGGTTVFISGDFGRLTMGDTDGGFDWAMAEVPTGSGSIDDVDTSHGAYGLNTGLDGRYDGQVLRYDYSVAGFGVAVSLEIDDTAGAAQGEPVVGVGFTYAGDANGVGYALGVGYQQAETAAGVRTDVTGLSVGVDVAGFDIGMNYSEMDQDGEAFAISHFGLGVAYSMDAWTFGASYGVYDDGVMAASGATFSRNHEVESYGLTAGYDLGGGASLLFGYANTDVTTAAGARTDADQWSFGLSMSF
jgi:outer membrane protein OmpU